MKYTITHVNLPEKEYLVVRGYYAFSDSPPEEYAKWHRLFSDLINNGYGDNDLVRQLLEKSGADEVFELFCNNCRNDERLGMWVVGRDIACENRNNAQAGDGFEIVRLNPSEYLRIEYYYGDGLTREQAFNEVIDYFNDEWIRDNPYESLIEGEYHYDPGTANLCLLEPDEDIKRVIFWNPIKQRAI